MTTSTTVLSTLSYWRSTLGRLTDLTTATAVLGGRRLDTVRASFVWISLDLLLIPLVDRDSLVLMVAG